MNEQQYLRHAIWDSLNLKAKFFDQNLGAVLTFYKMLLGVSQKKGHVLIFGNGGSAADAQHFAAELMHRVEKRPIGIKALALHTDTSLITALSNDEGFDSIYAKQINVLSTPADLAIAISTSGNSPNILTGLQAARRRKCKTVGLLGRDGGKARRWCDLALVVKHNSTPRIQEIHGMIIHLVCQLLENKFSGKPSK
jgi:D-sedoheptulose 7-phosphate isomerase